MDTAFFLQNLFSGSFSFSLLCHLSLSLSPGLLINVTQGTQGTPLPPLSNFLFYNISPTTKTIYTTLYIWSKICMTKFNPWRIHIHIWYKSTLWSYSVISLETESSKVHIFDLFNFSTWPSSYWIQTWFTPYFPFIFGVRISWRFLYWISPIFRCEFVEEGLAGDHLTHH